MSYVLCVKLRFGSYLSQVPVTDLIPQACFSEGRLHTSIHFTLQNTSIVEMLTKTYQTRKVSNYKKKLAKILAKVSGVE